MLNLISNTNVTIFVVAAIIAVALGGWLCYTKINYKPAPAKKTTTKKTTGTKKKTTTKKKSTKK